MMSVVYVNHLVIIAITHRKIVISARKMIVIAIIIVMQERVPLVIVTIVMDMMFVLDVNHVIQIVKMKINVMRNRHVLLANKSVLHATNAKIWIVLLVEDVLQQILDVEMKKILTIVEFVIIIIKAHALDV